MHAFEFGLMLPNQRQVAQNLEVVQSLGPQNVQINHPIGVWVAPHHRLGGLVVDLQRFPLPDAIVSDDPQPLLPHHNQVAVSVLIQVHRQHRDRVRRQRLQTLGLPSPRTITVGGEKGRLGQEVKIAVVINISGPDGLGGRRLSQGLVDHRDNAVFGGLPKLNAS